MKCSAITASMLGWILGYVAMPMVVQAQQVPNPQTASQVPGPASR
jgi:hypothetical protein